METTEEINAVTGPQPLTNGEVPSSTQPPTEQATMELNTYGRVFETTDELINHLKNEFEPHIQIPPRVPKEQKPTNPAKTVTIRDLY